DDMVAVAGQGLVDGVVHHLEDHVVQAGAVVHVADVHAGTLADGIQAAQDGDLAGIVGGVAGVLRSRSVGHRMGVSRGSTPRRRPQGGATARETIMSGRLYPGRGRPGHADSQRTRPCSTWNCFCGASGPRSNSGRSVAVNSTWAPEASTAVKACSRWERSSSEARSSRHTRGHSPRSAAKARAWARTQARAVSFSWPRD